MPGQARPARAVHDEVPTPPFAERPPAARSARRSVRDEAAEVDPVDIAGPTRRCERPSSCCSSQFADQVCQIRSSTDPHRPSLAHHRMDRVAHADCDPIVARDVAAQYGLGMDGEVDLVACTRCDHHCGVRLAGWAHACDRRVAALVHELGNSSSRPLFLEQPARERARSRLRILDCTRNAHVRIVGSDRATGVRLDWRRICAAT